MAEHTARSAREFRFEEIGPVTLKGKSTPVFMYRVVARSGGTLDDERGFATSVLRWWAGTTSCPFSRPSSNTTTRARVVPTS